MATIYLSSVDGNDADDGSTWALAKATMAAALTAAGAGGTVYVDSAHAESSTGTKTLASPGTDASPTRVLSADRTSGAPPTTLLAGGAVSVTTSSPIITITGGVYFYGITFNCGNAGTSPQFNILNSSSGFAVFDTCTMSSNATASPKWTVGVSSGSTRSRIAFRNCTISGPLSASLGGGVTVFENCTWSGTIATTCFVWDTSRYAYCFVRASDLSAFGSGKNLVDAAGFSGQIVLQNCKLGASVTVGTGSVAGFGAVEILLIDCDSADTNYRYHKQDYRGTITQETTIVRSGGATDGTTAISRKLVSTANPQFYVPLHFDIIAWNETTGSSLTATVEVVTDGVTLTDAEAWVEVEYLGNGSFPISTLTHDRATNILSTPANQTSSSVTWTTTGLSSPTKQKLEVTFTPQEKGPIAIRVHLAKASTTMYVCPKVTIA